ITLPMSLSTFLSLFFLFPVPMPTAFYTLSLHDALPIYRDRGRRRAPDDPGGRECAACRPDREYRQRASVPPPVTRAPRTTGDPNDGSVHRRLAEPARALGALRGRHRLDRLLVLFHLARQPPRGAESARRRGERHRGRALGRARRRLLPRAEVPRRTARAPGDPALVQVGGLQHVADRHVPAGRHLLVRGRDLPGRRGGDEP